jgi:uncharacterized lipoprotein YehR (DUF1307 family)
LLLLIGRYNSQPKPVNHMKNFRLTFAALACAAFITLTGCQKDDVTPTEEMTLSEADKSLQITEVEDMTNPQITTATETIAFSTSSTETRQNSSRLLYILRQLNLSNRQVAAVKGFIVQHEECVLQHRLKIQQYHEELLKRANAIREEYIQEYKAGTITKQELEARLLTLRTRLREEIQKHQDKQVQLEMMRRCRAALFTKIESILGAEQLAKWTQWKGNR